MSDKKDIKSQLRREITLWNRKYPIDLIWRKKYGVAFGSKEHLDMSFLDMRIDLEEEEMLNEARERMRKIDSGEKEIDDLLNIPEVAKMPAKEVDDEFENLDINSFYPKEPSSDEDIVKL